MEAQGNSVSRLAKLQLLYRNKQKEEMERRRSELADSRATVPVVDHNETSRIQIGNGKVRQMFDERRQRVTGIDKSYPLLPISSKFAPNNSGNQYRNTVNIKRSVNPNSNGDTTSKLSNRNGATSITIDNQSNRNSLYSKFNDADFIENEKTPDIFSQLDDIDTLDSGRRLLKFDKQMMNLKVTDSKNESGNIKKLGPVITRKTFEQRNSASSLNTVKKLPAQSNVKVGSIPIKSEKTTPPLKKGYTESSRSSASSNSSTKQSPRSLNVPDGMAVCNVCERNFNADRIEKHESICKKATTKKRKVFDITKHRVKGTEAEVYVKKTAKTTKKSEPDSPKKSDWRRKHEEFIQAIRSAKQVQQHLAKGGKLSDLPPPPAASIDPNYVQCPTCKRHFNRAAGERHIPKCASYQFNKPKPKNSINKKSF